LVLHLAERDRDQEVPQVSAALDLVAALADIGKEAAIRRLHDVFGVHALRELSRQAASGQRDQSVSVPSEQGVGCLLVAAAPSSHKVTGSFICGFVHWRTIKDAAFRERLSASKSSRASYPLLAGKNSK